MEKLRARCPSCLKLYSVEVAKITTENPEFQCVACETPFTFKYPPANPDRIIMAQMIKKTADELLMINAAQGQNVKSVETQIPSLKACPKCGAQNFPDSKECYSCQVVFEKIRSMPLDPSLRATPRLAKLWDELLQDFDNEELHKNFVRACQKENATAFATYRYQNFLEVQPHDEMAQKMKQKVFSSSFEQIYKHKTIQHAQVFLKKVDWQKWLPIAPFVLAAILIIIGFCFISMRNMVGFGAALAFLGMGLNLFFTGSLIGIVSNSKK